MQLQRHVAEAEQRQTDLNLKLMGAGGGSETRAVGHCRQLPCSETAPEELNPAEYGCCFAPHDQSCEDDGAQVNADLLFLLLLAFAWEGAVKHAHFCHGLLPLMYGCCWSC